MKACLPASQLIAAYSDSYQIHVFIVLAGIKVIVVKKCIFVGLAQIGKQDASFLKQETTV